MADALKELAPLVEISVATVHRRHRAGQLEAPESERFVRFSQLIRRAEAEYLLGRIEHGVFS